MNKCMYRQAYQGNPCGEDAYVKTGDFYACKEHDKWCGICRQRVATNECEMAGQFVCGLPLCDHCDHYRYHRGWMNPENCPDLKHWWVCRCGYREPDIDSETFTDTFCQVCGTKMEKV